MLYVFQLLRHVPRTSWHIFRFLTSYRGIVATVNCSVMIKTDQLSARTIGGAGTGKTTELLSIIEKLLDRGIGHDKIGFVSFTRAARREAAQRAAKNFGIEADALESEGWFRTLHSVAYRCLKVRQEQVVSGNIKSRKWATEALGEAVNDTGDLLNSDENEEGGSLTDGKTDAARALRIWGFARNTLQPVAPVWEHAQRIDGQTPPLAEVCRIIERYEQAKRLDNKIDFTDMLARFAGFHCTIEGAEEGGPEGEVPELTAWILDEAQDTSALSGAVFRRLIDTGECKYVYLSGDPFQSVYHFAGADHRVFTSWPVSKQRIAPKSWRCPAPILALGENILSRCSDYFDREISPADHDGVILRCLIQQVIPQVRSDESWLILTRCRFQANRIGAMLDEYSTPWLNTKGSGSWDAPKRNAATRTLLAMERGESTEAVDWAIVVGKEGIKVNHKQSGNALLKHGAKAFWQKMKPRELEDWPAASLSDWASLGVTDYLAEMIRSGRWRNRGGCLLPYADRYYQACQKYKTNAPEKTKVRIGTIHSSKGSEADNVVVLRSTTERCQRESESGVEYTDAEHRVWYVAVTRARRRLFVCWTDDAERGREPEYDL